eukprot:CAMPEP_0178399488 /NCGR_PEP_ID=MMETSP0689_2-20121128/15306_1 /TAXON_ID=160604 /ORGANISM="Amphidinium massartii, Strain CS-259" /LENGTH=524 /DNA_ID=CAMNT_0020020267 /DNA_START=44 /DNA_END=1618 /DNA_ORIENTATION=-
MSAEIICEADHHSCSQLSEVELQRACAPLYPPIAVDALANVLLFVFFFNVALMTHARGKLRSPSKALGRLILVFIKDYFRELWHTILTIPSMGRMPLAARLRCCGNIDKAISVVSTCVPLFAITRFLNIGNVNGARYFGYALTCPFMQMELIILIAPIVPCYCLNALLTFVATFMCLGAAWVSSVMSGPLYNGYIGEFFSTFDIHALDVQPKGMVVMPAIIGMSFIFAVQVPWLWTLYTCRARGSRTEDMPDYYRLMLLTVIITWAMFPLWWLFSWEGASLFKDAKLNEMGFMILNMTAKGTFIYQSSKMSQRFEQKYPEKMADEFSECPSVVGPRHSMHRRKNSALIQTLERFTSDGHKIAVEKSEQAMEHILTTFKNLEHGVRECEDSWSPAEPHSEHTERLLKEIWSAMGDIQQQLAETKKAAEEAADSKVYVGAAAAAATKDKAASATVKEEKDNDGCEGIDVPFNLDIGDESFEGCSEEPTPSPQLAAASYAERAAAGARHGQLLSCLPVTPSCAAKQG